VCSSDLLPESEARMTTVAMFRLTKDLETLDRLVSNQEHLITSITPSSVSFDRSNQPENNLPTISAKNYLLNQNSSSALIWRSDLFGLWLALGENSSRD